MILGINEQPKGPQPGDWVQLVNLAQDLAHINHTIAFVIKTDPKNDHSLIQGVRHPQKGHMPGQRWFGNEFLYRMPPELGIEDLDALIDWALDEKDEEAFKRLAEKRYSLDAVF